MKPLYYLGIGIPLIIILSIILIGIFDFGISIKEYSPESINEMDFLNALSYQKQSPYIDSCLSVNKNLGNFGLSDFTLSFWLKTSSTRVEYLMSKRNSCDCNENFWDVRLDSAGKLYFQVNQYGCINYATPATPMSVNDNKWHYIVAKRQGNNVSIYIDSNLQISQTTTEITNLVNTAVFRLGKGGCQGSFNGQIDELKIWDYAINESEILGEYASHSNEESFRHLLAYYKFDGNIEDSSYHNNTAEVYGNKLTLTSGISGEAYQFGTISTYNEKEPAIRTINITNSFILTKRESMDYVLCANASTNSFRTPINYALYVNGTPETLSYVDIKPGESKSIEFNFIV